ncbi:hypothetical protein EHI42_25810 [Rhizobium hidalgonense]|uniref:hypothetical protein n=1 Tax=Rhizobium hidalgonense TaxID=1538159 RepID=UPI000FEC6261|nr:hypothetical protein [Rhizobium hidalgonense]RWX10375.1 hypothetical protein EHI42_25810 [Rhizobium hidalgonense]
MKFLDNWGAPVAGVVMLGILLIVISGFEPSRTMFCNADEACLREWMSATSGWAAAVAAFVTLFALRRQIAAQERQIDHQLGNVEPDMYVRCTVGEDNSPVAQITIINRNRRPFSVHYLDAYTADRVKLFPHSVKVDESDRYHDAFGHKGLVTNCLLPGKEDGRGASTAVITCFFEPEGDPNSVDESGLARYYTRVFCHGQLHGEKLAPRVLTAEVELVMMTF